MRDINLRGVVTDDVLAELRQRNEERRRVAILALGSKWLGFPMPLPVNRVQPVLT